MWNTSARVELDTLAQNGEKCGQMAHACVAVGRSHEKFALIIGQHFSLSSEKLKFSIDLSTHQTSMLDVLIPSAPWPFFGMLFAYNRNIVMFGRLLVELTVKIVR